MIDDAMSLTVEDTLGFAKRARADGYIEIAEIFEGIAEKIAQFNEQNPYTVQELRERVGDREFWRILSGFQPN